MSAPSGAGLPDVLAAGPERLPRRGLLVALLALLVLAVLLLGSDRLLLQREMDALVTRAEQGRGSVTYADGRITAVLRYAGPTLGSADVSQRVRTSLQDLVREAAAERVADVLAERDAAAALRVLPWHREQREARDRLLADLEARLARLAFVAADFSSLYVRDLVGEQARGEARQALLAAVPGEQARITAAFGRED